MLDVRLVTILRFMHALSGPAAAEWAKPSRSAAALRSKGVTRAWNNPFAYLRIWLRILHLRIWNMLRPGVRDAETQLCVFLEHIGKLLRKVAFFPRAALTPAPTPPSAAKILK